jgi:hypothetical protein
MAHGFAQTKPDAESFSDHRRRDDGRRGEADSELEQFQREPFRYDHLL